jgi:hypothetical protein
MILHKRLIDGFFNSPIQKYGFLHQTLTQTMDDAMQTHRVSLFSSCAF